MIVRFYEPVHTRQPGVVNFNSCATIIQDCRTIQATIDGRGYELARVVSSRDSHGVFHHHWEIHLVAYAAIFGCPVADRPMAFYAIKIEG